MTADTFFKALFLIDLVAAEVIRFPHRMRNKQERRQKKISVSHVTPLQLSVDMLAFLGTEIVPLVYVFTPWLSFADYDLPAWTGGIGAGTFAVVLLLLWMAHAALGRNWSPTVEITEGQELVTQGIYQYVRHPIYTAFLLWAVAQALLLHNWLVGLAGLGSFLLVYRVRVPQEERMMLEHFGEAYRSYMNRTGGIIPRVGR